MDEGECKVLAGQDGGLFVDGSECLVNWWVGD